MRTNLFVMIINFICKIAKEYDYAVTIAVVAFHYVTILLCLYNIMLSI